MNRTQNQVQAVLLPRTIEIPMRTPWIHPRDQSYIAEALYQWNLITIDPARKLPLKNGGATDIYINMRNARNKPEALAFIAGLYAAALKHLGVDRFIEIPHAVSCFAGLIAAGTGIPYITIRDMPKEGRVGNAARIGDAKAGETVCIIDDVITDGASKIDAIKMCEKLGVTCRALVVLVDREQGWERLFAEQGITIPVWAGMRLHDVRRTFIDTGRMERCDQAIERANPIIVALDGLSIAEMRAIADELRPTGCILKVNDLLFAEGFYKVIPELAPYGRVMVDLKAHDIPNTVHNICKRLQALKPWAVTVHASGGAEMVREACAALRAEGSANTLVLAVTVLTSINPVSCEKIYARRPLEQVLLLAEIAYGAGAHGFVCSPEEVQHLRKKFPEAILVTPGIRSSLICSGISADDQQRISTPRTARDGGANYIVMGRQILKAPDPVAEVKRIMDEELSIIGDTKLP